MNNLVTWVGIMITASSFSLSGQTIVPNPRPGTVLWKRSVEELDPRTAPALDGALLKQIQPNL